MQWVGPKGPPPSITGFALFELIVAISIFGVIVAGVTALASKVVSELRVNEITDKVESIRESVTVIYGRANSYDGLEQDGLLNGAYENSDTINPYGDKILVKETNWNNETNGAFVIKINGLNSKSCSMITTRLFQNWDYLEISNTVNLQDKVMIGSVIPSAEGGPVLYNSREGYLSPNSISSACIYKDNTIIVGRR